MFHGNPTWSFLYRNVIKELGGQFRCVAVDYPGFGLSERPSGYGYTAAEHGQVIGQLVDHLDLNGFIVVGQDWGGPIGMTVALERAERVAGLVFANTWYWPAQGSLATFSVVMSTPPAQWLILQRNAFVNSSCLDLCRRRWNRRSSRPTRTRSHRRVRVLVWRSCHASSGERDRCSSTWRPMLRRRSGASPWSWSGP